MSNELLEYPKRHYGMDHDRYEWSMLQDPGRSRRRRQGGRAQLSNLVVQAQLCKHSSL